MSKLPRPNHSTTPKDLTRPCPQAVGERGPRTKSSSEGSEVGLAGDIPQSPASTPTDSARPTLQAQGRPLRVPLDPGAGFNMTLGRC